ncbi:gamma-glutamyl-gamma-aminobutyrate hydrolase family protein [Pannonibacter sp. Pt2-lr]
MRVLVIENYPLTPHGQVGRALANAGAEVTVVKAFEGEAVPLNAAGYAGLAVFGGGQNALDDEGSPFLPQICDLIRGFHAEQKPVLGICLGSQLIARAFGGRNIIGRPIEFGWHDVMPTDAGKADPVLSALGRARRCSTGTMTRLICPRARCTWHQAPGHLTRPSAWAQRPMVSSSISRLPNLRCATGPVTLPA